MKKIIVSAVSAAALLGTSFAFAGGPDMAAAPAPADNDVAGFYVNGNVGYGHVDVDISDIDLPGVKIERNSFAWSANVGYQFNKYIAVEGGYMMLPYIKVSADGDSIKLHTNAGVLVAKGMYPISDKFDVFAKAGIAYLSHSVSVSAGASSASVSANDGTVEPVAGLGVDYNITPKVAVTAQAITTIKTDDNFPATYTGLVGLSYKFS